MKGITKKPAPPRISTTSARGPTKPPPGGGVLVDMGIVLHARVRPNPHEAVDWAVELAQVAVEAMQQHIDAGAGGPFTGAGALDADGYFVEAKRFLEKKRGTT